MVWVAVPSLIGCLYQRDEGGDRRSFPDWLPLPERTATYRRRPFPDPLLLLEREPRTELTAARSNRDTTALG